MVEFQFVNTNVTLKCRLISEYSAVSFGFWKPLQKLSFLILDLKRSFSLENTLEWDYGSCLLILSLVTLHCVWYSKVTVSVPEHELLFHSPLIVIRGNWSDNNCSPMDGHWINVHTSATFNVLRSKKSRRHFKTKNHSPSLYLIFVANGAVMSFKAAYFFLQRMWMRKKTAKFIQRFFGKEVFNVLFRTTRYTNKNTKSKCSIRYNKWFY